MIIIDRFGYIFEIFLSFSPSDENERSRHPFVGVERREGYFCIVFVFAKKLSLNTHYQCQAHNWSYLEQMPQHFNLFWRLSIPSRSGGCTYTFPLTRLCQSSLPLLMMVTSRILRLPRMAWHTPNPSLLKILHNLSLPSFPYVCTHLHTSLKSSVCVT